jgi:glutaredoxin 3
MNVKIYSTSTCPYCIQAKELLMKHDIIFEEILLTTQEAIQNYRKDCPDKTTVPQILIDGVLIGGYDDLVKLPINKYSIG